MLLQFTDLELMGIGVGAVALVVILALLFMKWEAHRATTMYPKRNKKSERNVR